VLVSRSSQPRDRNGRWTTTGRGASLGSQRQDFAKALQHGPRGDNSGKSTVYAYLRDKDSPSGKAGSPYYVGVAGSVYRPYAPHNRTPVPSDERRIRMLRSNLTHEQARDWEKYYIAAFGRKDNGTGRQMLINRTDGGEGTVGAKVSPATRAKIGVASANRSAESRAKTSASSKGRTPSKETRAKLSAANKGRIKSEEERAKLSAAQKGKAKSAEHRAKMSAVKKDRPAEEIAKAATSRIRNTAARHGVDPDVYLALSASQRHALRERHRRGKRGEELLKGI
jgi:hypothetical protein